MNKELDDISAIITSVCPIVPKVEERETVLSVQYIHTLLHHASKCIAASKDLFSIERYCWDIYTNFEIQGISLILTSSS